MGTHTGSGPAADVEERRRVRRTRFDNTDSQLGAARGAVVRARHQTFGFTVLGALCCLAAVVFTRWNPQEDPGRWYWSIIGTLTGVVCLVRAQRAHGNAGADRDASPYYGMFAGVTSGALVLMVLSVDVWVLPGVFFLMAAVLALMAWIEQSAIGMTAAVCVAVLSAGSGVAGLDDTTAAGFGSLAIGVMLFTAAIALDIIEDPTS